ncbi:ATP-binding protein [Amycolatopsis minnesotensis]|uniref:ATP-binding protein n=1 Tax=Amycolatopsis minnesotensis TaxID=337894 RepID=UPI0031D3D0D9
MTRYIGGVRERAVVRRLLGANRLVTLTGPGGIGKTRLARQVMRDVARAYPDGVVFAELAAVSDGALLTTHVADLLGAHGPSRSSVSECVVEHLRDRAVLVVLDNCEHLVADCARLVHAILAECSRVVVLGTSRHSLGIAGEQQFPVLPLQVPGADVVLTSDEAGCYEAIELFADRAVAVQPGFRITDGNCADIARLCRRLDGVPLAIEMAVARLRTLTPRQITERMDHCLTLLTTGRRTAPPRQRSLRATLDWSYALCSDDEQRLWAHLSVFAGSFDLPAVEHVCATGDAVDTIDGLVDKSVVLSETGRDEGVRYRLLEPVREYGHERLLLLATRESAARRHRDWYDQLTARADAEWLGPRQSAWWHRLWQEHANVRAAVRWSLSEPGEAGVALRMAARVEEYWTLRGAHAEARLWLDRALAAAPPDHPDRPLALVTAAAHSWWLSDLPAVSHRVAEAESLIVHVDDELLHARVAYARVLEAQAQRDARCREIATGVLPVLRRHGDHRRTLRTLTILGGVEAYLGDIGAGRARLRDAVAFAQDHADRYYRDIALFGLALIETQFGDVDTAADAARTALASTSALDSRFGDAFHIEALAWIATLQGHHWRAATLYGAAATAWESLGSAHTPLVARPHQHHLDDTRRALGSPAFDRAYTAGHGFTATEARQYALEENADTSPDPPEETVRLTQRQHEIAELVAQGLSNREIAARLVISVRTAETHVRHIMTRLGATTRTQVATWYLTRSGTPVN